MTDAVPFREVVQKTSIVLGYDNLDYETASHSANKKNVRPVALTPEEQRLFNETKKSLRATHFTLGDDGVSYETSSQQIDPTGELDKYTAKLNVGAKNMLRKTSATLGYDSSSYETTTSAATKWNKGQMIESMKMRESTKNIADPRKVNYDFGTEKINYTSTTKESYVYDSSKAAPAIMAESVKSDLRKCHYTLGNDRLDYSTSNHLDEVPVDVMEKARGSKHAINPWKTSINLGHE